MNIDKMRADALAAFALAHNDPDNWYSAKEVMGYGLGYGNDATHIANCSPEVILRLLDVVEAADTYYRRYAQDEAEEDGHLHTGCTLSQHEDALALKNALKALEDGS